MSNLHYLPKATEDPLAANSNKMSQGFLKNSYDKQFKVIIIGDSFCGKTSLLMRINDGKPSTDGQNYEATIGVDCKNKTFLHGDQKLRVRLQIWDTAG